MRLLDQHFLSKHGNSSAIRQPKDIHTRLTGLNIERGLIFPALLRLHEIPVDTIELDQEWLALALRCDDIQKPMCRIGIDQCRRLLGSRLLWRRLVYAVERQRLQVDHSQDKPLSGRGHRIADSAGWSQRTAGIVDTYKQRIPCGRNGDIAQTI